MTHQNNTNKFCSTKREAIMFLGLSLEYYDFIIYSILVSYIYQVFFPVDDPKIAILKTVMIFVVGNFSRILGSIFLGFIYDKIGIKKGLSYSIMMMGLLSILIGSLPASIPCTVYEGLNWSVIFLIILRFLQGLIYSVEIPGSIVYAKNTKQTQSFGTLFSVLSFGYILASFGMFILTSNLSNDEMLAFGWRIPFIFGGVASFVGFYLRIITQKSQIDNFNSKNSDLSSEPAKDLTQLHKNSTKSLIEFFTIENLKHICQIIGYFYGPALMMVYGIYVFPNLVALSYEMKDITLINTISVLYSIIISPFIGKKLDWITKNGFLVRLCLIIIFGIGVISVTKLQLNLLHLSLYIFSYQTVLSVYYVQGLANIGNITQNLKYKTTVIAIGINLSMILSHFLYANMNFIFAKNIHLAFLIFPVALYMPIKFFKKLKQI